MEVTTLGDTEKRSYARTKRSTDRLLALLKAAHELGPVNIDPPAPALPKFKAPWFSIEGPLEPQEPRKPLIEAIQNAVAKHYSVSRADILSQRRTKNIIIPRQVAAFLSRELTANSIPAIGRKFGGRDHTTILSSIRKIERLVIADAALAAKVEIIRAELTA